MPLIKSTSKEAFGKNIKAELAAGKPLKQSVAIAYSEKRSAGSDAGESTVTKPPSNASTIGGNPGKGTVHHSSHRAAASDHYHKNTVESSYVRPSATKMTKTEHQLNNEEDMSEKGHKL
jgi:hypothetical protein